MSRRSSTIAVLLISGALTACGGEGPAADAGEVRLVEGARAESPAPAPTLDFESPERGAALEGDELEVRLALEGFALGEPTLGSEARGLAMSDGGQHVHFIVDDRPYRALYDLDGPVPVDAGDLGPGLHLLRAFPSRQWHESVKSEGAFARTWFFLADSAEEDEGVDPEAPMLTYSRPKGAYEGSAADSVMVDFYVTNVEIGSGEGLHRVRLTVDDSLAWELTRWTPHYVLGLDDGTHTFRLELLTPDHSPVSGPHGVAEREIVVDRIGGDGGS